MIKIFCSSACRDVGKPTQSAACGIVMKYTDDKEMTYAREFTWWLHSSTTNLADLQSIRLALAAINKKLRKEKVQIHFTNRYVAGLLERENGKFTVESKKHAAEAEKLRRQFIMFQDVELVLSTVDDMALKRSKELAKFGLDSKKPVDSGTFLV